MKLKDYNIEEFENLIKKYMYKLSEYGCAYIPALGKFYSCGVLFTNATDAFVNMGLAHPGSSVALMFMDYALHIVDNDDFNVWFIKYCDSIAKNPAAYGGDTAWVNYRKTIRLDSYIRLNGYINRLDAENALSIYTAEHLDKILETLENMNRKKEEFYPFDCARFEALTDVIKEERYNESKMYH